MSARVARATGWPSGAARAASAPAVVGLILFAATVAWPAISLGLECLSRASAPLEAPRALGGGVFLSEDGGTGGAILLRSAAWAFGLSLAGTMLAWPAARLVRRTGSGGAARTTAAVALLVPVALPPWLLSASLWLSCGPGTAIGDLAESADAMPALRRAILVVSLTTWSASLAAAVLLFRRGALDARDARMLALDRAGVIARLRSAWCRDGALLAIAFVGAGVFLLGETTAFDLAQIATYGFELRSRDALGATPVELLARATPAMALGLVATMGIGVLGARTALRDRAAGTSARDEGAFRVAGSPAARAASLVAGAIPVVLAVGLLALFIRSLVAAPRAGDFMTLHGAALANALGASLAAALLVAAAAVLVRIGSVSPRRTVRLATLAVAGPACIASLVPATITAVSLESAYNRAAFAAIYDGPAVVVLALASRSLVLAVVVGLVLARRAEPHADALRALDGRSLRACWRGWRVEAWRAGFVALVLSFAWNLGELTASGRVLPPGMQWIATDILNAIHYQRPETVLLATAGLLIAALGAAWSVARMLLGASGWRPRVPRGAVAPLLAISLGAPSLALLNSGCARSDAGAVGEDPARAGAPSVEVPLKIVRELAGAGRGPGQFNGPRVLAIDARRGRTFVIDKDARVQRFDAGEVPTREWRLPKFDRGKPVGASVAPDGTLVVADTHEHRVVGYSPEGELLWELGSYGLGPAQFIYPTDVAFAPDGRMFVAEYGGNDRIQVFSSGRELLYAFGAPGSGERQFMRPQALAFDAARDELYVLEVGNHRVQVLTGDGEFRRALGRPGRGAGELSYPFGLILEIAGEPVTSVEPERHMHDESGRRTVVVAEHSNHRIQRLDGETGESLGIVGGIGAERGRLKYPWALEPVAVGVDGRGRFAVCDNGNSRIAYFDFPPPAAETEPR